MWRMDRTDRTCSLQRQKIYSIAGLIFTMIENNTGRRRKVRQCVLPVERGGVDGCVGDAEAEEVGLHPRDLLGLL